MIDFSDDYLRNHRAYVLTRRELREQLIEVAVISAGFAFLLGALFGGWIA